MTTTKEITTEKIFEKPIKNKLFSYLIILAFMVAAFSFAALSVPAQTGNTRVTYKTVRIDGLNIFYREAGSPSNPTVLLLHGFPTSSQMFRNLMPQLASRYHLVAPDYPGYGNSSAPAVDKFDYTFDNIANIVDKFTQSLKLERYSLYVMDYGAPVGYRLAVKHPERVQSLIIQNGNAYEEGLRDFWIPFKAYWKDRSEQNAEPLKKLLIYDATKWQYTNGTRNVEMISPDAGMTDQYLMDRPGNKDIQLQLFYSYGSNPPLYSGWQEYFRKYQPPTLIVWGKMISSSRQKERNHTNATLKILNSISWIPDTLHLKRIATRSPDT